MDWNKLWIFSFHSRFSVPRVDLFSFGLYAVRFLTTVLLSKLGHKSLWCAGGGGGQHIQEGHMQTG